MESAFLLAVLVFALGMVFERHRAMWFEPHRPRLLGEVTSSTTRGVHGND